MQVPPILNDLNQNLAKLEAICIAHLHIAQPFGPILDQKLLDDVFGDGINVFGPFDFAAEDFLINPKRIVVVKRRITCQHLVDQHS